MPRLDLTQLGRHEQGRIVEIQAGRGLVRRLEALGLRIGTIITKVSGQPMRGPVIVRVGNTQVALGFGMARKVMVVRP